MPATNAQAALKFAQRIRDHIEHTNIEVDQKKLHVTVSIGVASYPDLAVDTLEDLLKKADEALYQAKRSGRNTVMMAGNAENFVYESA
ncbi:MAG TPA: GGDEF domain-containing protein, partial [Pseudomonadales bacterium]|nr:GGDEF domain-containing protein [Pseudomonadales bacterium]